MKNPWMSMWLTPPTKRLEPLAGLGPQSCT